MALSAPPPSSRAGTNFPTTRTQRPVPSRLPAAPLTSSGRGRPSASVRGRMLSPCPSFSAGGGNAPSPALLESEVCNRYAKKASPGGSPPSAANAGGPAPRTTTPGCRRGAASRTAMAWRAARRRVTAALLLLRQRGIASCIDRKAPRGCGAAGRGRLPLPEGGEEGGRLTVPDACVLGGRAALPRARKSRGRSPAAATVTALVLHVCASDLGVYESIAISAAQGLSGRRAQAVCLLVM